MLVDAINTYICRLTLKSRYDLTFISGHTPALHPAELTTVRRATVYCTAMLRAGWAALQVGNPLCTRLPTSRGVLLLLSRLFLLAYEAFHFTE